MTKTQIQVPQELFTEIHKFSARREWSLAETFLRGAELLLKTSTAAAAPASQAWTPPTSRRVDRKGLTAAQLRDLTLKSHTRRPSGK